MSQSNLNKEQTSLKTGGEDFYISGKPTGTTLRDFWRWSASDLLSNATRGILAEFIVAQALEIKLKTPRVEWDDLDLKFPDGTTIEVKTSAYLQSWHQTKPSNISFNIRKTKSWDPVTNLYAKEAKRQANIYIFALLIEKDIDLVNPLDLDQWRFYVVRTEILNDLMQDRKTISLIQLEKFTSPVSYSNLSAEFYIKTGS